MRNYLTLLLFSFVMGSSLLAHTQNGITYGIRAGYLHSLTHVKKTASNTPFNIIGLASKPGFYLGGYLTKETSGAFLWLIDLNYQNKGQFSNDIAGSVKIKNSYHYLGATPMVGLKLSRRLSAAVGPEVNFLIGKKSAWSEASAIEVGVTGRLFYRWNRLGLQAGYFRAINKYDGRSFNSFGFDFINSNLQVGLMYDL